MELSKSDIPKTYEGMLFETFYFVTPNFVELLHVMGSVHEYFQNFIKCLSASIKFLKAAGFVK